MYLCLLAYLALLTQIPSVLIASIGYGSHLLVFRHHMDTRAQLWYQFYVSMVWVSYAVAIVTPPGSPPKDYVVPSSQWQKWCTKCQLYKPQRAHHCRKCNVCVLKMDHHCVWTKNCVGHSNMPHFMRFLVWVLISTGVTAYHLGKQALVYYDARDLPAYLVRKTELCAVVVLLPLDAFVFVSVLLLFLRCVGHIVAGNTQIEEWERERLASQCHTERFWMKIRNNYRLVHGKDLPRLTSWNLAAAQFHALERENDAEEDGADDPVVPRLFTRDDFVFPYDLGVFRNIYENLGNPFLWLVPWSGAPGNGFDFEINNDGDQLNLPWPPDGGNVEFAARSLTDEELLQLGDIELIKKHLDPRSTMKREAWTNDDGDGLQDYGVEVSAEEEKGLKME